MRLFLLQIVDASTPHRVIRLPGGDRLERDLRESLKQAVLARGVGWFRSEAHVARALDEALEEVIDGLKRDSRYATGSA